jgi:hypothetical protein
MVKVYIGYDEREDIAASVCKFSIERNSSKVKPVFLKSIDIPEFKRPREANQSTDFTYTRFMIPFMENYTGYSIFCDCDFLFLHDLQSLLRNIDLAKAVSVVKHPAYIPKSQIKMDGIQQHIMPRKNWASLMVFNNSHPACKNLTPDYVNTVNPGRKLHTLDWVNDEDIGSISLEWNTLDGYYELNHPKAIHYTDGGPWFPNYKNTFYSEEWWNYYEQFINASGTQRTLSKDL